MPVLRGLRERLADDLDSPGAIARVDEWAREALASGDGGPQLEDGAPALVRDAVDALLGVQLQAAG
jgi:L-cysteine:1D-myo-inositol 2-amino-2-deoxy-alpha-D-glucopyranoside ligase